MKLSGTSLKSVVLSALGWLRLPFFREEEMTNYIYNKAFDLLMKVEGGYVNDPRDKGGETKYGISKKQYPNIDIKNLTLDEAKDIYFKDYWLRNKCDTLPDCLSVFLFDFCVNSNSIRARKFLQEALNVKIDGVIGNQTIAAAHRLPLKPVLDEFYSLRVDYLMGLKDFNVFGKGWMNRVREVKAFCDSLV